MRFIKVFLAVLAVAGVFAGSALALAFDDQSYIWPNGKVGVPYAKQLGTRGDCPPFKYDIIGGSLPPGIGLSLSGLASGTPTKAGTFSFWVRLRDCLNMSSEREFSVVIEGGTVIAPVDVTTSALRIGIVGQGYSAPLAASGGGAKTWSASGLPAGLALSGGTITGTPAAAGDFTVTVIVSNGSSTKSRQLSLRIVQPLNLDADLPPAAEVGRPFSAPIAATGGSPAYAWAIGSLPPGLAFDSARGVVSGIPAVAGSYDTKVTLTDGNGFATALDLRFVVSAKLALGPQRLKRAKLRHAYAAGLDPSGGVGPLKWTSSVRLPRGLRLDAKTGRVLGTPRVAGTFRLRIAVRDALGATATRTFVLAVRP
jgi:large repetitive protein